MRAVSFEAFLLALRVRLSDTLETSGRQDWLTKVCVKKAFLWDDRKSERDECCKKKRGHRPTLGAAYEVVNEFEEYRKASIPLLKEVCSSNTRDSCERPPRSLRSRLP